MATFVGMPNAADIPPGCGAAKWAANELDAAGDGEFEDVAE